MIRLIIIVIFASTLFAQREGWTKPYPAHTIAGNLHNVGTEDLACFLISTNEGHILINTGVAGSVPLIRDNMSKLGFKLEDIKILLIMQAHHDHTAGLAEIQKIAGAKMFVTEGDAAAMADGGKSDPAMPDRNVFPPVRVDRKLKDGDRIRLGGSELRVVLMLGHSRGSTGYELDVTVNGKKETVLIANMATVVMPLVNPKYPDIVDDYRRTFARQKKLTPNIWVAAHGSQYGMVEKHRAGSFHDPGGYRKAVANYEKLFLERLAKERP
jgi:metallo-beta-lactamase class B